jgi:hypothetical protein
MPTVLDRVLLDTTLPGANARRVWVAPGVSSHSVLVMTPSRLYAVANDHIPSRETLSAIDAGADLETLFAEHATPILLFELTHVELDLQAWTIELRTGFAEYRLTFTEAETADDVFAKLLHRTRDRLQLVGALPNRFAAIRTPLGVLFGIWLATLLLALTISAAADLAPPPGDPEQANSWFTIWLQVLAKFDWRHICAAGGIAAGWAQIEIYQRYRRPPGRLTLTTQPQVTDAPR